jgi:hypothetical protein
VSYLKVKDWEQFQHYKDRNPPWIKLSTDTFQDYEFSRLQDASKLLAICIWTLASRYKDPKKGLVPADFKYIKSQCGLGDFVKEEHLKELIEQGFVIDASNMLADRKQSAIPETETYSKETEEEKKKDNTNVLSKEKDVLELYKNLAKKKTLSKKIKTELPYKTIPEDWLTFCQKEMGWTNAQAESAFNNFNYYWTSDLPKDKRKINWKATFVISCRNGYTKPTTNLKPSKPDVLTKKQIAGIEGAKLLEEALYGKV